MGTSVLQARIHICAPSHGSSRAIVTLVKSSASRGRLASKAPCRGSLPAVRAQFPHSRNNANYTLAAQLLNPARAKRIAAQRVELPGIETAAEKIVNKRGWAMRAVDDPRLHALDTFQQLVVIRMIG
jgi:hypothetical protein